MSIFNTVFVSFLIIFETSAYYQQYQHNIQQYPSVYRPQIFQQRPTRQYQKPGKCPNIDRTNCPLGRQNFMPQCKSDLHCPYNLKCCKNICDSRKICMAPNFDEEITPDCPDVGFRCFKPYDYHYTRIFKCNHDDFCPDGFKCCTQQCFRHKICVEIRRQGLPSITTSTPLTINLLTTSTERNETSDEEDVTTTIRNEVSTKEVTINEEEESNVEEEGDVEEQREKEEPETEQSVDEQTTASITATTSEDLNNTEIAETTSEISESEGPDPNAIVPELELFNSLYDTDENEADQDNEEYEDNEDYE